METRSHQDQSPGRLLRSQSPPSSKNETHSDSNWEAQQRRASSTSIHIPMILICVPMLSVVVVLIAAIFGYRIKPKASVFDNSFAAERYIQDSYSYILVNLAANRITFWASLISTIAPLLAGSMMLLSSTIMFQHLKQPSTSDEEKVLPTPYQLSLLIGNIAASYEQLWKSLCYLVSRKRTTGAPALLWYTATGLLLCLVLGVAVVIADAWFHTVTEPINFNLYSSGDTQLKHYGRGLNKWCYDFDRLNYNDGFPCSYCEDTDFYDPNMSIEQAQTQYLYTNSSDTLQIRQASVKSLGGLEISYLIPNPGVTDLGVDYRATTFGVSAQCKLIPSSQCDVSRWENPHTRVENFNCSDNFWGALGLAPNGTDISIVRQPSAYVSFLSIKTQQNLQYGFFSDRDLQTVYNTAGLNDSGLPDPNLRPLSDLELSSKIYAAFAWRSSIYSFLNGPENEMTISNLTSNWVDRNYIDYFTRCELTTYDVEYVWFNQSLLSISATQSKNGTLMNIWQGATSYGSGINGAGYPFQTMNALSTVAGNTTSDYENKFGTLLGQYILSKIGGYTSSRPVLQQQRRTTMLLTKVPTTALVALSACSLLYPVIGIALWFKVRKYSNDHKQMAPLFSYWGLASAAWKENMHNRRSALITAQDVEACDRKEKIRLCVERDKLTGGFYFALWKNGSSVRPDNIGLAV